MENLFKPKGTLLALFMFLPITPSIAAITVFTKSVFHEKSQEITSISRDSRTMFEASKN